MIVREKQNWYKMLFVWNGSVLKNILPRLLFLLAFATVVTLFKGEIYHHKIHLSPAPFTLVGIALAIFLGFCNSSAYDRFWEGRKLWGALVIDCRSLARQAVTMSGQGADSPSVRQFINLLIAFTFAMKHQLRNSDPEPDLRRLLPEAIAQQALAAHFKPVFILNELSKWVNAAMRAGKMDTITQAAFDQNLNLLSGILGGCERIATTPIPYTYSVLLHRTVYLYCFLLPFGLVDTLGWMTPFMTLFISYTFIALEAIVREIEDPFGTEANDLPLDHISETIENSLREMTNLPVVVTSLPSKDYVVH